MGKDTSFIPLGQIYSVYVLTEGKFDIVAMGCHLGFRVTETSDNLETPFNQSGNLDLLGKDTSELFDLNS